MQALTAISPVDGRYRDKVDSLANYFSESALIRYRVMVEVEYFIALCELPLPQLRGFDHALFDNLKEIYLDFTVEDAQKIKDIEKVTNHDVKAVEYFIKERFDALNLHEYKEFIHFGLTSQDINNTAVPCSFRDAIHDVYYPVIDELIAKLEELAEEWKDVPMLAKTHGQPASPTRLGKEIRVFVYRLTKQLELLKKVDYKTLLFFVGLFVVVGGLEQTGILELIAGFIGKVSGGNLKLMIAIIIWVSAIASAFVDNIPFAATMIPVVKSLAAAQGVDLSTLAWALSMGTDIGGSATPIGASANVVGTSVAAKNGYMIGWGKYCKSAAPATIIVVGVSMLFIFARYC